MAITSEKDTRQGNASAKAVHTNMMIDCTIANLPSEVLRSTMRALLGGNPTITSNFQRIVLDYLTNTKPATIPILFDINSGELTPNADLQQVQSRYRCLMGCGYGFESMELLTVVLSQFQFLASKRTNGREEFLQCLATIDGDVVQAVTAIQKQLMANTGARTMSSEEQKIVGDIQRVLKECSAISTNNGKEFPFERGMCSVIKLTRGEKELVTMEEVIPASTGFVSKKCQLESVKLGGAEVPRMFMGLWQFSSPAWGTASKSKIDEHFRQHVDAGLIAYDMADHYGDAEVTFGQFRSSQTDFERIYCATKWAVFEPIKISQEVVSANVTERLTSLNATCIELLQFHWQDYNDHQYLEASKLIEADPRVQNLGLCNFDTVHMDEILDNGVKVVSNQVQFSLIDLRPTFKMESSCRKHQVKLLTYGSLCGGFLADKWIGKRAPNLFDKEMTPSHRKYLEMIIVWGGWLLFQELLGVLSVVGKKYGVSVSSVAIRWVLDHDYVGAVIVGARMGISEHVQENLTVFSLVLDDKDRTAVGKVLEKSKARDVFEAMGDCGSEYRQ